MEPVTLTTGRLLLRPFAPADTDETFAACQDPDIQRWTTVPSPYAPEDAAVYVQRIAPGAWRDGTEYGFAVRLRTEDGAGALVSAASLHHPQGDHWQIGYWTAAEHRGRGYTAEAVLALARWSFRELGCTRLEWRAEVGNTGSRAVAERVGFTVEGTLRAALLNKGVARDCWVGSLLPHDLGLPSRHVYLPARSAPDVTPAA
ncbi:GNAT family N-acetyltransferase [Streptomyces sp. NPDC005955]|jgi:RimJ/RimL family protein N-acetyltransferase|uniref:GNAT family N-acetyltransferase n=1 Tax=Streptomyces sp. NPDC005955 TaxID=3364738 RepID=UPI0036B314EA